MSTTSTPEIESGWVSRYKMGFHRNFRGVLVSFIVAVAATFLSEHYGASVMLFALLLGMAVNFLSQEGRCVAGIQLSASHILRIGVALLGMRITFSQITELGLHPVLMVVLSVTLTICFGLLVARAMGFSWAFGMLTGGAVAICGASAALAIAAVMPFQHPMRDRAMIFTVIGVSALSTIAMIAYPMVVHAIGLDPRQAGIFLGGTIHDVAQVVGAGYGMSNETGDAATVVKLLRVAMLLPVIFLTSVVIRIKQGSNGAKVQLLPWFAVAFAVLVALNSTGMIPVVVQKGANDLSRWCLVIAIAAIGMKTQLKEIATVGLKPIALMVGETLFLALLVLGMLFMQR